MRIEPFRHPVKNDPLHFEKKKKKKCFHYLLHKRYENNGRAKKNEIYHIIALL